MKHQQVVVDYWSMVKTSCTCLLLALSGYILIKMVQTVFWLPGYLQNNQKRLEELAAQYSVDLNDEIADEKNLNEMSKAKDEEKDEEKAKSTEPNDHVANDNAVQTKPAEKTEPEATETKKEK